jgi:hypothetical protein
MMRSFRSFLIVGAIALAVVVLTNNTSQAQARVLPNSQSIVNPYYRVAPGLPLNQAAYNIRVLGQAYSRVPPWVYGYNPYPAPVIVTSPYYPSPVYPYAYSPYPTYAYPSYAYPYGGYPPFYP